MKLHQLRYLAAVAQNGLNITAAAEKLHTSQPGVSKQIKLLEDELGFQIFVRDGRTLTRVTPAGQQVIDRAVRILREVQNIKRLSDDYKDESRGSLSIATTHTQARYVLPEVIRRFRELYPDVRLHLHQGTSEQIADMVAANEIDFAIATGSRELFGDLLLVPSYRWDRKILVPNDHPLTRLQRPLTLHDLAEYPLVTYVFSFGGQSSLKKAFSNEGLEPDVVFTARDADVIKTYVRMGLGVGIVASMAEDCDDRKDLTAIEAEGLFPRSTTWIGFRKDAVMRRYMLDFAQLFAPHITATQLEEMRHARTQDDIDKLYAEAELPIRGGCSDNSSLTEQRKAVGA